MKLHFAKVLVVALLLTQAVFPQERIDEGMVARIKTEGFQNSKAAETIGFLTDVFGPRLTGSPSLRAAQNWTLDTMSAWGLQNSRLEPWGSIGHGWSIDRFSAEMTAPTYDRLNAYPLAWSPGTAGVVSGTPIIASIRSKADFEKYRGKLKNAILFRGLVTPPTAESRTADQFKRFSDDELAKAHAETNPAASGINGGETTTYWDEEDSWQAGLAAQADLAKFLKDEGVAAVVQPSRLPNGVLSVSGHYQFDPALNVPTFVLAREQYARIQRLTERKIPVKVELSLSVKTEPSVEGHNIIAEITGTDPKLKDEIVLLGGHFDSWHAGTGAADNAAGCVALMEAMRILRAVNAKPRRTIRIALWDGEEQSYFGSVGYVKTHYGDPLTLKLKPGHQKLSAYFNLDNGSGRIRGIFLQGNEAARPIFESYFGPFNYLGAKTISVLNTGGTDHMVFEAVGLPGFQFIQDPLDYNSRVHHTNLDVLESVSEVDVKANAVIIASVAYHTAMRDEKIPREAMPRSKQ